MKAYVAMAAAIFAIGIAVVLQIGSPAEALEATRMTTAAGAAVPWSLAAPSRGRAGDCREENCWWGCCDANGACQLGTADDVCGIQGMACTNCAANGYYCGPQQVCAAGVPCTVGCNDGCCDAFDECRQFQGDRYCGVDTGPCTNCAGEGKGCGYNLGVCTTGPCTQATCPYGCCDAGGQGCLPGTDDNACGFNAQTCQTCPAGQQCIANVCQTPCSPAICPSGCCNGAVCVAFADQSNILCGAGGAACGACGPLLSACLPTADGGLCGCDAASCPDGCCENGLYCRPGTDDSWCGGPGGAACVNCVNGENCIDRACVQPCNSSNCGGCCSGADCESGLDPSNCGQGGIPCVTCPESWSCVSGVCTDDNDDDSGSDDDVSPADDDDNDDDSGNDDDVSPADDDDNDDDSGNDDDVSPADDDDDNDDDDNDDDSTPSDDDESPGDDDDDSSPGIHRAEHANASSGCGC